MDDAFGEIFMLVGVDYFNLFLNFFVIYGYILRLEIVLMTFSQLAKTREVKSDIFKCTSDNKNTVQIRI